MFDTATEILPHESVLLVRVCKPILDEATMRKLVVDVRAAAAKRTGVPIVLDVSRVHFAPSGSLGLLVQLAQRLRLEGRRLVLVNLDPHLLTTIRVTHLDSVIEIHDSVDRVATSLPKSVQKSDQHHLVATVVGQQLPLADH
ncbi:MAG: STAS domain-containing protein [Phycisphaerae bacterium]|nr:STAS domain-containing protein [Phycisphaerae bacterium]